MSPSPVKESLSTFTPEEWEAIESLRQRVGARSIVEDWKLKSDNFILRYLRANHFDLDKAEQMIETYTESLKEYKYSQLAEETFPKDFSDKFVTYVGGQDKEGRPIAMIPYGGLWNLKEAIQKGQEETFIRYVLKVASVLEKMVIDRESDYGTLICDLSNVAYGNFFHKRTLEVLLFLVRMMEKCAPGLIGKVYIVNSSKLCVALFNTIKRMVTLSTDVYLMDSNEEKWKATLLQFIPEDGMCQQFGGVLKSYVTV